MKQEVTVDEVARFLQVNRSSAIQRMSRLVKKNKAVRLNWPTKGAPARFLIDVSLEELLETQKFAKKKMSPHVDWRKFCSDPFNLGKGAR
jgi:predicted transcriptional regulator